MGRFQAVGATPAFDVKKELKPYYNPRNVDWELVDVPAMRYVAVDGAGDPNAAESYVDAVHALYSVVYTIRFAQRDRPFVVGPLEGLWWAEDPNLFVTRQKADWSWTMLISLPPWLRDVDVESAKQAALIKKKLAAIEQVRVLPLSEGKCAQLLHVGSYDDEGPKLARLHHEFMPKNRLTFNGHHHEIYLSDPRRTEPPKLKTVLRQPVTLA